MASRLFLIPSTIGDTDTRMVIPDGITDIINSISHFIVEDERTARRMLLKLGLNKPISDLYFHVLNEHTDRDKLATILEAIKEHDTGLLSDAGVPAIADPGK